MPKSSKLVRQSISIPTHLVKHVRAIAKTRKASANRVLVDLIEAGLEAKTAEKEQFFALAARLTETNDASERQRIKKQLARMTFGD
ncbi:MAG TPA: hypothetical protein VGD60_03220 [Candidatus Acidoferrales bacterium]